MIIPELCRLQDRRYAAAGHGHDDCVIALALAKYAATVTPATGQTVGVWQR